MSVQNIQGLNIKTLGTQNKTKQIVMQNELRETAYP